jgi:hypothetical protein
MTASIPLAGTASATSSANQRPRAEGFDKPSTTQDVLVSGKGASAVAARYASVISETGTDAGAVTVAAVLLTTRVSGDAHARKRSIKNARAARLKNKRYGGDKSQSLHGVLTSNARPPTFFLVRAVLYANKDGLQEMLQ